MNLTRLGFSSWILILNLFLFFTFLYVVFHTSSELFVNYPQQVNPRATPKSDPDATNANNNYASLLLYIQSNPSKSVDFVQDIKQKFFNSACTIKSNIDFANIAQMPNGMPFK
jgi:hypothetical protein